MSETEEFYDCSTELTTSDGEHFADAPWGDNEAIVSDLIKQELSIERFDELTTDERARESDAPETDEDALEKRRKEEEELSEEEIESRRQKASEMRQNANRRFAEQEYEAAGEGYEQALDVCPLKCTEERHLLLCNWAAALLKQSQYEEAIVKCTSAIELNGESVKAFYRRAYCHEQLGDKEQHLEDALKDYQRVLELDANNQQAKSALVRLPEMINDRNERLKAQMMDQLKQLGNAILRPFGLSTDNFRLTQNADGGYSISMQ